MNKIDVAKVMSTDVMTVQPDTRLETIAADMARRSMSCAVVCDGDKPIGLISEWDLTRVLSRVLAGAPAPRSAADVMSSPAITIASSSRLPEAMDSIRELAIRRLVVTDGEGRLAGLITQTDLLESHAQAIEAARDSLEGLIASRTTALEEANRQLEALALEDSLMGIGNRRAMELDVQKCQNIAARYGRSYGVVLLDVDFFKSYNDHYGHLVADGVLKRIAQTLSDFIRGTDTLYRYGGEEILLLLPETRLAGAMNAGERARLCVESLGIEHKGSPLGIVTLSAGVAAQSPATAPAESDWRTVVNKADKALYRAKAQGRNRFCVDDPEVPLEVPEVGREIESDPAEHDVIPTR